MDVDDLCEIPYDQFNAVDKLGVGLQTNRAARERLDSAWFVMYTNELELRFSARFINEPSSSLPKLGSSSRAYIYYEYLTRFPNAV